MLSEEQLEIIAEAIIPLFQYLEKEVIVDIARRIQKTLTYSRTAELQAMSMARLGYSPARIRKEAMKLLKADPEFRKMVAKNTLEYKRNIRNVINDITKAAYRANNDIVAGAGNMSWVNDLSVWKSAGKELTDNSYLKQLTDAFASQTAGELKNMTQSTGFKAMSGYENIENAYRNELDKAVIKICSGTFSQDKVIRDVVHDLAQSGLRSIDYASGYSMQLDTAARLAIRTGCHQLSGKILDENIKQTGENLVYVSKHWGARNTGTGHANHEQWQGKVYFIKEGNDYREEAKRIGQDYITDLWRATGYSSDGLHENDPLGLYGYNCMHNHHPWFEGTSSFPDDQPQPGPVIFNGKTYDYYAMTQKMRSMERTVRALKREKEACRALGMDTTEIQAKIKRKTEEYNKFCKKCGIPEKTSRMRYECGTSDLKKTKAWNGFDVSIIKKTDEKYIDFGNVKNVTFNKEVQHTNLSAETIETIKQTISDVGKQYNIRLDRFEIKDLTDEEYEGVPMFFHANDVDGRYESSLIINNNCSIWKNEKLFESVVDKNIFAGKSIRDFTMHEMAHVITFQNCESMEDYMLLENILRNRFISGISRYNNECKDGAETIAEAFVLYQNNVDVPENVIKLLNEYVEVHRYD